MSIPYQLIGIPAEAKTQIKMTLPALQRDYHFQQVKFWGVIKGDRNDYFICRGYRTLSISEEPVTFFTFKGGKWAQLPELSLELIDAMKENGFGPDCQTPFTGDPSVILKAKKEGDDEEADAEPEEGEEGDAAEDKPIVPTELHRVAHQVAVITAKTSVAPIGMYYQSSDGVRLNPGFSGLSMPDAIKLNRFARVPKMVECMKRTDGYDPLQSAVWVTSNLSAEKPTYTWKISHEPTDDLVTIENRYYPGAVFYMRPGTTECGLVYSGTGLCCVGLPFMLR